jgi:hypothetical protein
MTELAQSDLETMERLAAEWNAEVLKNKRLWEAEHPGSVAGSALAAPTAQYALKSWNFEYVAAFYVHVWATVAYQSGDVVRFSGGGGGVAAGGGAYFGGAPNTSFSVSPQGMTGLACTFYLMPVSIGALVHFWTDDLSIGTVVGAGPAVGIGAFGGSGTWSAG